MEIVNQRLDIQYLKGVIFTRVLTVNKLDAGVIAPYDLTAKVVKFRVYDRSTSPVLLFELDAASVGIGTASFSFTALQASNANPLDYIWVEIPVSGPELQLGYGAFFSTPLTNNITVLEMVRVDSPAGLVIPENYITVKGYEWRLFLQHAIEPNIADVDINTEAAWPILVNFLIAKLIVYDYLLKQIKSFVARNEAGSEENAAMVKKIETGPANAEFFDGSASVAKLLQQGKNGIPIQTFAEEACQLAKRLKIYLPMCKNAELGITIPMKQGREPITDELTYLLKNFGQ